MVDRYVVMQEATARSGSALRRSARSRGCRAVTRASTGSTYLRIAATNSWARNSPTPLKKQKASVKSRHHPTCRSAEARCVIFAQFHYYAVYSFLTTALQRWLSRRSLVTFCRLLWCLYTLVLSVRRSIVCRLWLALAVLAVSYCIVHHH